MSFRRSAVVCALAFTVSIPTHADDPMFPASTAAEPEDRALFVQWARESLTPIGISVRELRHEDFHRVGEMIGDASLVALGEGHHMGAEPLEFRNRLLRYLVEQKGFTAIAIESGLIEGRLIHDYVRGASADLDQVISSGITWTFDQLPQNRALIEWIRSYNADARHPRKISFYGFDISGSPGNPSATVGMDVALTHVLRYLARVEGRTTGPHEKLRPLIPRLRLDLTQPASLPGYESLKQPQRDLLTASIADLVAQMERGEARYIAATSVDEYQWAYRSAIVARQLDQWLRQMPVGWRPFAGQIGSLSVADDVRDRGQAENIEWILRREGEGAKVLVFGHSIHISMAPLATTWWQQGEGAMMVRRYKYASAGTYLKRWFGNDLVTIGNVIGRGETGCGDYTQRIDESPIGSITDGATAVGSPSYMLDLRQAPLAVQQWLGKQLPLGQPAAVFDMQEQFEVVLGKAFDVLFYLGNVSPACSTHPH